MPFTADVAVIPAAGLGTRMRPLSLAVPKELLPVGRWPMIQYAIVEAVLAGVAEIVIVLPPERKTALVTYIDQLEVPTDGFPGEEVEGEALKHLCEVHIVEQPRPGGLADAVSRAGSIVGGRAFYLLLPDNIFFGISSPCRQLARAYEEFQCETLGLIEMSRENAWRFGNAGKVEWRPLRDECVELTQIYDKQAGSFDLAGQERAYKNCGRSILTTAFLEMTESIRHQFGADLDDVPVLQSLIRRKRVVGVALDGEAFDVGNWQGYLGANARWLKQQGRWN